VVTFAPVVRLAPVDVETPLEEADDASSCEPPPQAASVAASTEAATNFPSDTLCVLNIIPVHLAFGPFPGNKNSAR